MQTVLAKLQQLVEDYRLWTQNHPAYNEAVRHPSFTTEAMRHNFEACIQSTDGCNTAGVMEVMRQRIDYFEHFALLRLLGKHQDGWQYFDRAYDNAFWLFRAGTFSERTLADVPFLLAYSHQTGYRHRTDYIGRFLYEHQKSKLATLILQHSDTARFMTLLWAHAHQLSVSDFRPFHLFEQDNSPYAVLLEHLDRPDNLHIQNALDKALNQHILESADKNHVMHRSLMSHLFPVEILYYLNIRTQRGQSTLTPRGNILWQKFKELHNVQIDDYLQALLEQDEPLKRVFYLFAKRGTFQAQEWEYFYQRN